MQITLMKAEPDIYYAILKRLRQNANRIRPRKGDLIKNAFNFRQREGKEAASWDVVENKLKFVNKVYCLRELSEVMHVSR